MGLNFRYSFCPSGNPWKWRGEKPGFIADVRVDTDTFPIREDGIGHLAFHPRQLPSGADCLRVSGPLRSGIQKRCAKANVRSIKKEK